MGGNFVTKVNDYLTEEGLFLLKCWARDYALQDVAAKIGIDRNTLRIWGEKYPQIREALAKGREVLDYEVENALLKRALGCRVTESKTILEPGGIGEDGKPVQPTIKRIERTEKEILPDPTSIAIWLNNRKPDQWKRNRDNIQVLDETHSNITVHVVKHSTGKKPDSEEHVEQVSAQEWDAGWNTDTLAQSNDDGWDTPTLSLGNKENTQIAQHTDMRTDSTQTERSVRSTIKAYTSAEEDAWLSEGEEHIDEWQVY